MGGGCPFRAIEAASLHAEGLAPEIWVVQTSAPDTELALARLGLAPLSEDMSSRSVLRHLGVSEGAIRTVKGSARNTADEIRLVASQLTTGVPDAVILVTSKAHTRRVRVTWCRLVGARARAIVRAARDDPFDADHWWRRSEDALAVVREVLGLANAWAGYPVQPGRGPGAPS
jgi:hypothetical protein